MAGRWRAAAGWTAAGLGGLAALVVLAFYGGRLGMPLPIFASDEATYLIRAIYPDEIVARNPFVLAINNAIPLSLIRALYNFPGSTIVWDRAANGAAYLLGLLGLWRWSARTSPRTDQVALLLLAVGFPFYRFAFSNMPEGLYVGLIAGLALFTAAVYQRRPILHAAGAGLLCAALVLTKPHGVAVMAGLLAMALLETAISRRVRLLALRLAVFAAAFLVAGNLIQARAQAPVANPLLFFMSDFYSTQVRAPRVEGAYGLGLLTLGSMVAALAVLGGPPILVGLADLGRRLSARGRAFRLAGADLAFLLMLLSAAASLAMVTVFAMKIASSPSESERLWGRYFEFFVPLIWLSAAPALGRTEREPIRGLGPACGLLVAAGLGGLLLSFHAGIVLFPWDSSILTAFFHPDPVRAPLYVATPYRGLAVLACLGCAAALAARVRPAATGAALILALGLLSTALDHVWLGPLIAQRDALAGDLARAGPLLPGAPEAALILCPDPNEAHLAFLGLGAEPRVLMRSPGQAAPADVASAETLVICGPEPPASGEWTRTYRGERLSVFRRKSPAPGRAGASARDLRS